MYNDAINKGIKDKLPYNVIARKIYLSYPTHIFQTKNEIEFKLINSISTYFNVPFKAVQVAGSSKTGFSYAKKREFAIGDSDLDIAIIDSPLFLYYSQLVFEETKGFRDVSKFGRTEKLQSKFDIYRDYLLKGIFRPDLMPSCDARRDWFNFFNKLSEEYFDLFSDINAGVYLNEYYFEFKQAQNVDFFLKM